MYPQKEGSWRLLYETFFLEGREGNGGETSFSSAAIIFFRYISSLMIVRGGGGGNQISSHSSVAR